MEQGLIMKYFVLKPGGNDIYAKASRAAMLLYAEKIETENKQFAYDIRDWVSACAFSSENIKENK
jgi:hypothetical protein